MIHDEFVAAEDPACRGNAEMERAGKVEIPLAVRGCRCPEHYPGVGTTVKKAPFLWLKNVSKDFPPSDETGHSLIVAGHFTGKTKTPDLRTGSDGPHEWNYRLPVFEIGRRKENTPGYDVPAPHAIK